MHYIMKTLGGILRDSKELQSFLSAERIQWKAWFITIGRLWVLQADRQEGVMPWKTSGL